MRVLALDIGRRRIGLAISDRSRTLARPLATLDAGSPDDAPRKVASEIARLAAEEDGVAEVVVGLPVRLDGSPGDQTAYVQVFGNDFFQRQGTVRFERTLVLPANRGRILDRNGLILASSVIAPSVWAIPEDRYLVAPSIRGMPEPP